MLCGKDRVYAKHTKEFFMKKKSLSLFLVLFGLVFLNYGCITFTPASPTARTSTRTVEDLIGVWEGSYIAGQGETGLTLTVTKENEALQAVFKFYNLPGRTNAAEGSYFMNITYQSGRYTFRGYEWIEQPSGYGFLDLEGTVDSTGNTLRGTTIAGFGSSPDPFTLARKE
jgi:hypothetical protein